jgi:hypothetical protein
MVTLPNRHRSALPNDGRRIPPLTGGYSEDSVRALDDAGVNRRRGCCLSAARGHVDNDEVGTRAEPVQHVFYEFSAN